jgi:8-oxo-dGTP pyrophosphatase MutT (NUDIX family)
LPDFKILSKKSYDQADVEIIYAAGIDNAMPKDRAIEILIEESWSVAIQEAKKHHINIFNGMLFRLKNIATSNNNTLRLELGDTNYKEYIATRTESFYKNRLQDALANPLATCIAIVTRENEIIIEKRGKVDVYPGQYHVIGGFVDRSQDFNQGIPDPFKAIVREVYEETGLKLQDGAIQLVGIVYDLMTPHSEMCFYTDSNLSSKEITEIFTRSQKDREVDKLEFINASRDKLGDFIVSQHHLITVTGQACLTFYGKHKYGTQWFRKVIDSLG